MGVNLFPDDEVHSSWAPLGRATTVVGANREGGSGEALCECKGNDVIGGVVRGDLEEIQRTQGGFGECASSVKDENGPGTGTTQRDPSGTVDDPMGAKDLRVNQAHDAYRKASDDIIKLHNLVLKISWPEAS